MCYFSIQTTGSALQSTILCFKTFYNTWSLTRMVSFLRNFNHTSIPEILVHVNRLQMKIPTQQKYIFSYK